jgi:hypothetical protein
MKQGVSIMNTGAGILIVWADIPPEIEDDYNEWYNREHMPDRILRMPGFLRGRRYVATEAASGAPKYLTYYDLQSATVMQSDAHQALRKNRTERDKIFVPQFRNPIKGICDVAGRAGRGDGGWLVVLPVVAETERKRAFAEGVCRELLPALAAARGIASAVLAGRNAAITQASSAKDDRAGDRYLEGAIAVEATSEAGAAAAVDMLRPQHLSRLGGSAHLIAAPCVMRLLFTLHAPAAANVAGTI